MPWRASCGAVHSADRGVDSAELRLGAPEWDAAQRAGDGREVWVDPAEGAPSPHCPQSKSVVSNL